MKQGFDISSAEGIFRLIGEADDRFIEEMLTCQSFQQENTRSSVKTRGRVIRITAGLAAAAAVAAIAVNLTQPSRIKNSDMQNDNAVMSQEIYSSTPKTADDTLSFDNFGIAAGGQTADKNTDDAAEYYDDAQAEDETAQENDNMQSAQLSEGTAAEDNYSDDKSIDTPADNAAKAENAGNGSIDVTQQLIAAAQMVVDLARPDR